LMFKINEIYSFSVIRTHVKPKHIAN
jgi:hypothetical protein